MQKRIPGFLILLGLLTSLALAKPEKTLREDWSLIYFQNQPIGTEQYLLTKLPEGNLRLQVKVSLLVKQKGVIINQQEELTCLLDPALRPLSFVNIKKNPREESRIKGVIKKSTLYITITAPGIKEEKTFPFPPQTYLLSSLEELLLKETLKKGKSYCFKIFDETILKPAEVCLKVVDKVKLELNNRKYSAFLLQGTHSELPGIDFKEWRDEKGRLLKTEIPSLKLSFVHTGKAEALKKRLPPDFSLSAYFPAGCYILRTARLNRLDCLVSLKAGDLRGLLPCSKAQKVELSPDQKSARVKLEKTAFNPESAPLLPITVKALENYLKPSPWVQSCDPEIIKLAGQLKGEEKNSWEVAKKINRWVFAGLEKKQLEVAFLSAREVLKARQGDCTEHSVLFAALARAAGIPTRLCAGLVYNLGYWGFHMWPEVWMGEVGEWVAVDPTLNQAPAFPTHLKLQETDLAGGNEALLNLSLLKTLNRITIKILGFKSREQMIELENGEAGFVIEDDRYLSPLNGFSLNSLPGWQFEAQNSIPFLLLSVVNQEYNASVNIFGEENLAGLSPQDYLLSQLEMLEKLVPGFVFLGKTEKEWHNLKIIEAEISGLIKGKPYLLKQRIIPAQDAIYLISALYPEVEKTKAEIYPQIEKIMESFQLLK